MSLKYVDDDSEIAIRPRALPPSNGPLHQHLPTELLMDIFARLRPKKRRDIRYLHVCRMWRAVILQTPEFWIGMLRISSILGDENGPPSPTDIQFGKVFIERSAFRRFDATLDISPELTLDVLAPHAHRISSLVLYIASEYVMDLIQMLRSGMEHLRLLAVHHKSDRSPALSQGAEESLQNASFSLPSLRSLHVPFAFLAPNLASNSLLTLELGGWECDDCTSGSQSLTVGAVLSFLQRCPSLVDLCFLQDGASLPFGSHLSEPARLPSLRRLSFGDSQFWGLSPSAITKFLVNLDVPPEAALTFRYMSIFDIDNHVIFPPVREWYEVSTIDRLRIAYTHMGGYQECTVKGWAVGALKLDLVATLERRRSAAELIDLLVANFGSASVTDLSVSTCGLNFIPDPGEWSWRMEDLFGGFPSVTRLKLTSREQPPDDMLSALATEPLPGTAHGLPMLCPNLRELVVHWKLDFKSRVRLEEFEAFSDHILSTLSQRGTIGYELAKFVYCCGGVQYLDPAVGTEELKARLRKRLEWVADVVVVNAYVETTEV